ncbi:unnamed protein product [Chrysoparadoxa australica]
MLRSLGWWCLIGYFVLGCQAFKAFTAPISHRTRPLLRFKLIENPSDAVVVTWVIKAGKRGAWQKALVYLNKLKESTLEREGRMPDLRCYNVVIKVLGEHRQWQKALKLLRDMEMEDGLVPDTYSYGSAINALAVVGVYDKACQLLEAMKERGVPRNVILYGALMNACERDRRCSTSDIQQLLRDMVEDGVTPNVFVINSALGAYAQARKWGLTFDLLENMEDLYGAAPNVRSYNRVMSGLSKAGEWQQAVALLEGMLLPSSPVQPDTVTYNCAVSALGRSGELLAALNLLKQMKEARLQEGGETSPRPDIVTYNTIISACATVGDWETALSLVDMLLEDGLQADTITYNAALSACCKDVQWQMGLDLLNEMKAAGVPPDVITYNTLLAVIAKAHQYQPARALLDEMQGRGIKPDEISYACITMACHTASPPHPTAAIKLLHGMQAGGLKPSNTTYNNVLRSLGKAGRASEAMEILTEMEESSTPPDAACYESVVYAFERSNNTDSALAVLQQMKEKHDTLLGDRVYATAIRACEKEGRWEEALGLLEELRSTGAGSSIAESAGCSVRYNQWYQAVSLLANKGTGDTDSKTIRAAIVGCSRGGHWQEALSLMDQMKQAGHEVGAVCYGAAMEALERQQEFVKGLDLYRDMLNQGIRPDIMVYQSAIRCCWGVGEWRRAVSMLAAAGIQGMIPTRRMQHDVIRACAAAGEWREAWGLKQQMIDPMRAGAMPDLAIYRDVMQACGDAGEREKVLRCVGEVRKQGRSEEGDESLDLGAMNAAADALEGCGGLEGLGDDEGAELAGEALSCLLRKARPGSARVGKDGGASDGAAVMKDGPVEMEMEREREEAGPQWVLDLSDCGVALASAVMRRLLHFMAAGKDGFLGTGQGSLVVRVGTGTKAGEGYKRATRKQLREAVLSVLGKADPPLQASVSTWKGEVLVRQAELQWWALAQRGQGAEAGGDS